MKKIVKDFIKDDFRGFCDYYNRLSTDGAMVGFKLITVRNNKVVFEFTIRKG